MSEKQENIYECNICHGQVHVQYETDEELQKWLDTMFGICPAGGNHVEIGRKRDYLVFVDKTKTVSKIPTKKEVLHELLEMIKKRQPILIVGLDNRGVPNIHNFCPKEIYQTVKHCGFGFFEGKTEKGTFSFDAGGAMIRINFQGGYVAWSPLRADPEVLVELGYDFEKVEEALQEEIEKCE